MHLPRSSPCSLLLLIAHAAATPPSVVVAINCCRLALLGKMQSEPVRKYSVAWNASSNRADGYNEKARMRHVELVVARILRARARTADGRSKGLE
jgi:hypothetical protein